MKKPVAPATTRLEIADAGWVTDETVIGYNPENADLGNRDGAIYGKMIFIHAETAAGRRFVHEVTFENDEEEKAGRLVARVKAAGVIDLKHWNETYEIYGSAAWQAADNLRAMEWAMGPHAGSVRDF